MLRLAFDFIITWRETRTRPNAYAASINVEDDAEVCLTIHKLIVWMIRQRVVNGQSIASERQSTVSKR